MNNKFLRFLVVFLQILIIAVELAICIYSIVFVEDISENYFTAAVVRISAILLMTIAYYKTSVSRINPGNLFIIFFLFSITVAELTVLSRFTAITGWSLIPPRALARTSTPMTHTETFLSLSMPTRTATTTRWPWSSTTTSTRESKDGSTSPFRNSSRKTEKEGTRSFPFSEMLLPLP